MSSSVFTLTWSDVTHHTDFILGRLKTSRKSQYYCILNYTTIIWMELQQYFCLLMKLLSKISLWISPTGVMCRSLITSLLYSRIFMDIWYLNCHCNNITLCCGENRTKITKTASWPTAIQWRTENTCSGWWEKQKHTKPPSRASTLADSSRKPAV